MSDAVPRFFFDYVDPSSYVLERRLRGLEAELGVEAARHPFELVPPPGALLDPSSGELAERWERALAAAEADGVELRPPDLVPWSRKAHELVLYAREQGPGREAHDAVFRAYHVEGRDIGRVDVLVDLAVEVGLDRTATKAVLDVDRYLDSVRELRRVAERLGVPGVPTLLAAGRMSTGLPAVTELRDLLPAAANDNPSPT